MSINTAINPTHFDVLITDGAAYEETLKLAQAAGAVAEGDRPARIVLFNKIWSVQA